MLVSPGRIPRLSFMAGGARAEISRGIIGERVKALSLSLERMNEMTLSRSPSVSSATESHFVADVSTVDVNEDYKYRRERKETRRGGGGTVVKS